MPELADAAVAMPPLLAWSPASSCHRRMPRSSASHAFFYLATGSEMGGHLVDARTIVTLLDLHRHRRRRLRHLPCTTCLPEQLPVIDVSSTAFPLRPLPRLVAVAASFAIVDAHRRRLALPSWPLPAQLVSEHHTVLVAPPGTRRAFPLPLPCP